MFQPSWIIKKKKKKDQWIILPFSWNKIIHIYIINYNIPRYKGKQHFFSITQISSLRKRSIHPSIHPSHRCVERIVFIIRISSSLFISILVFARTQLPSCRLLVIHTRHLGRTRVVPHANRFISIPFCPASRIFIAARWTTPKRPRYKSRLRNITVDVHEHVTWTTVQKTFQSVRYLPFVIGIFAEISRADSAYGCVYVPQGFRRCTLSGHKSTDISSFRALRSTKRNFNG